MTRTGPAQSIRSCVVCGAWYGDDEDGHKAHQKVFGHRPRHAEPVPEQQQREEDA